MKKQPYHEIDHSHCWESKNPPCGQKIEHLECCLCKKLNPKIKKEKQVWLRLDGDDGWQIIVPESDTKPHSAETTGNERTLASLDCPCNPKVDMFNKIIIHNSFEDQERIDDSMRKLNL